MRREQNQSRCKVVERLVNTADFVNRGQPLMRIDRTDFGARGRRTGRDRFLGKALALQTGADEARARALRCGMSLRKQSCWYEFCIYNYLRNDNEEHHSK
jgi:hypothetical protein